MIDKSRFANRKVVGRNFLTFCGFVAVAAIFWWVMALNDSVQRNMEVEISINNVPDTVTFINLPPETMHVIVRDRGSHLLRNGLMHNPVLNIDFADYAEAGHLRFSRSDLLASLKNTFGATATISSTSLDSISLLYSTGRGRRVPVRVICDATAVSGKTIFGRILSVPGSVTLYSLNDSDLDTITRVYTQRITVRDLDETKEVEVPLKPIRGVRIIPERVKVSIPVEALVKRQSLIPVNVDNVPAGTTLLLFPSRVKVSYYVPMSQFSEVPNIDLRVDYHDTNATGESRLPVRIVRFPASIVNPTLSTPTVEYTIQR